MRHFLAELKGRTTDRSAKPRGQRNGGSDAEKFGFGPGSAEHLRHMIPIPESREWRPNESRFPPTRFGFWADRCVYQIPSFRPSFRSAVVLSLRLFSDHNEILPRGLNQPGRPPPPSLPPSLAQVARWPPSPSRSPRPVTQAHISFEAPVLPSSHGREVQKGKPAADPYAISEPVNGDDNSMSVGARAENTELQGGRIDYTRSAADIRIRRQSRSHVGRTAWSTYVTSSLGLSSRHSLSVLNLRPLASGDRNDFFMMSVCCMSRESGAKKCSFTTIV